MQRQTVLRRVSGRLALAHEAWPASLEINETAPGRYDVLWRTPLLSEMRLPVRLAFPEAVHNHTEPRERVLADASSGG